MLLYSIVEANKHLLTNPLGKMHDFGHKIMSNPFLPSMFGSKELLAFFELNSRIFKNYEKPKWGIDFILNKENKTIPVEIKNILSKPFCNLLHFETPDCKEKPTILVVAPLSGHYPTLLRDTVKQLLPAHNVFLTEWINAKDIPVSMGTFSLSTYIEYLMHFLSALKTLDHKVHMLSVCQPTVPALCTQAILSAQNSPFTAQSLILIGGPIDARKSPTAVTNFALKHDIHWFERNLISTVPFPYNGAGRDVYPGFLQHMGFVAMNPRRHAQAHHQFFNSLTAGDESSATKHREFYDEYNAVMDLPKEYYLQTIQEVFQDFSLAKGTLKINEQLIEPQSIQKGALLTIEGALDDISGAGQTHAAQELCKNLPPSKKQSETVEGVGHYGVFSGSKFGSKIVPLISDFINKNNF